jgi:hypothetical protein
MRTTKLLLFLFTVMLGYACEKEESKVPGLFLKQIIFHKDVDEIAQYTYSNDGKLIRYEYIKDGVSTDKEEFLYVHGQLDSSSFYLRALSTQPFSIWLKRSYVMDESDRIISFFEYETEYYTERFFDFYYRNDQLDSIVYKYYDHVFSSSGECSYKVIFDMNGNIVNTICTDYTYGTREYKYDNKKNPLKSLTSPENFATYFSTSNVTKDATSTYTYEYNENDLPVSCIKKFAQHAWEDSVVTEMEYVYSEL